jgi:hypothetical protein
MKLVLLCGALCVGAILYGQSLSTSLAEEVTTCDNVDRKMDELEVLMNKDHHEVQAAKNRNTEALKGVDLTEAERASAAYEQSLLQYGNAVAEYETLEKISRACVIEKGNEMLRHHLH